MKAVQLYFVLLDVYHHTIVTLGILLLCLPSLENNHVTLFRYAFLNKISLRVNTTNDMFISAMSANR